MFEGSHEQRGTKAPLVEKNLCAMENEETIQSRKECRGYKLQGLPSSKREKKMTCEKSKIRQLECEKF